MKNVRVLQVQNKTQSDKEFKQKLPKIA